MHLKFLKKSVHNKQNLNKITIQFISHVFNCNFMTMLSKT